jgi:hypothetical protein
MQQMDCEVAAIFCTNREGPLTHTHWTDLYLDPPPDGMGWDGMGSDPVVFHSWPSQEISRTDWTESSAMQILIDQTACSVGWWLMASANLC